MKRRSRLGRQRGEREIDEILEILWTNWEEGKKTYLKNFPRGVIEKMVNEGLLEIKEEKTLLTRKGQEKARKIIRRHRLAERLLSDIFELSEKVTEEQACKFEHILSSEVTEAVCTFLGHPPICPHGKPIPKGECCLKSRAEVTPLIKPLNSLPPGEEGKVILMNLKHETLDRLSSLGLIPGVKVKLHQSSPSYVIKVGETDLALDENIVRKIYVRKK